MIALFMHLWPILAAVGGLGGAVAAIALIPGALPLAARFWREIALAVLAGLALFFFKLSDDRATEIVSAKAGEKAAVQRADEWKAHSDKVEDLAAQTEVARAAERTILINLAKTAATAKQGIANAPGATDAFRYSDAAYGFLRDRGAGVAAPAEQAPADVGRR